MTRTCSECPRSLDKRNANAVTCTDLCRARRRRRLAGVKPSIPHRRDELDRYYTDPAIARKCVLAVLPHLERALHAPTHADPRVPLDERRVLVEPSVGGGAFLSMFRELLPDVAVVGVDRDPESRVLTEYLADYNVRADFAAWTPRPGLRIGAVVGNPPYNEAEAHCRHAIDLAGPDGVVAFLLPLAFRASRIRQAFWRSFPAPITRALEERPSFTGDGKTDSRDYALYVWGRHIPPEPGIGAV